MYIVYINDYIHHLFNKFKKYFFSYVTGESIW